MIRRRAQTKFHDTTTANTDTAAIAATAKLKREDAEKITRYQEVFSLDRGQRPEIGVVQQQTSAKGLLTYPDLEFTEETNSKQADASSDSKGDQSGETEGNDKEKRKNTSGKTKAVFDLSALDQAGPSKVQYTEKLASTIKGYQGQTTEDKAVQMRQSLSAEKLRPQDDLDNDSSFTEEPPRMPRYVLVGWDSNRSKIMLLLTILLLLWACIYFPLIAS